MICGKLVTRGERQKGYCNIQNYGDSLVLGTPRRKLHRLHSVVAFKKQLTEK